MLIIDDEDLELDDHNLCRYEGELFSGVGYRRASDGVVFSETTYIGGFKDGLERYWGENGQLESEGTFFEGDNHGLWKRWHSNGQLALERLCEFGLIVSEREWDEDGTVIGSSETDPKGECYDIIVANRKIHRRGRR